MPKIERSQAEIRLVAALIRMQAEAGLMDAEWAGRMGISQGHWSHIKRGHRGIGKVLAARILEPERFPQLFLQVQALFLPSDMQNHIYTERKKEEGVS